MSRSSRGRSRGGASPRSLSTQTDGLLQTTWEKYLASGRGSERTVATLDETATGASRPRRSSAWWRGRRRVRAARRRGARGRERPRALARRPAHVAHQAPRASAVPRRTRGSRAARGAPRLGPRSGARRRGAAARRRRRRRRPHAWNKHTMSQALRRVQYAVRGEVVMKADALAEAGARSRTRTSATRTPSAGGRSPSSAGCSRCATCPRRRASTTRPRPRCSRDALERARGARRDHGGHGRVHQLAGGRGVPARRRLRGARRPRGARGRHLLRRGVVGGRHGVLTALARPTPASHDSDPAVPDLLGAHRARRRPAGRRARRGERLVDEAELALRRPASS